MAAPAIVVAHGARTPMGLWSAPSAAALRAAANATVKLPYLRDKLGHSMPSALDPDLERTVVGTARILAMIEMRTARGLLAIERRPTTWLETADVSRPARTSPRLHRAGR